MKIKDINRFTFSLLILTLVVLNACKKADDFLDVLPSKRSSIPISTTAHLDALFNAHATMGVDNGGRMRILATDDIGLTPQLVTNAPNLYNNLQTFYNGTWDTKYADNLSNSNWTYGWSNIFTANLVLASLPTVSGSDSDKARLEAEAHFVRAIAYWELANTYCLPYTTANRDEPGLPLKLASNFEEDLTRVPLHRIYELIEEDLKEALKITDPLFKDGMLRPYRANIAGVNAFAARYYLFLGNYAEAERYATISLNAYSTLINYNNPAEINFSTSIPIYPNTTNIADPVLWKEFTAYRSASLGSLVVPSTDFMNLFDRTNDFRYIYYVAEGGGTQFGYPLVTESYISLGSFNQATGTTVGETLVTKAEALARLNRVPEAITTVNLLRAARMRATAGDAVVKLTATTQAEAVTKILEERRRELPFTMRWFDLRRLNHNDDPNDNKTLTRQFWQYTEIGINTSLPTITYTLAPGSRKWAFVIPKTEIIASQNVITQNKY